MSVLCEPVLNVQVLTLFSHLKGASLRGAVDVWVWPLPSLIDQGAVRVGHILNLKEGRLQLTNCMETKKINDKN